MIYVISFGLLCPCYVLISLHLMGVCISSACIGFGSFFRFSIVLFLNSGLQLAKLPKGC